MKVFKIDGDINLYNDFNIFATKPYESRKMQ